jgi:low affinity Fe/Cu permease
VLLGTAACYFESFFLLRNIMFIIAAVVSDDADSEEKLDKRIRAGCNIKSKFKQNDLRLKTKSVRSRYRDSIRSVIHSLGPVREIG